MTRTDSNNPCSGGCGKVRSVVTTEDMGKQWLCFDCRKHTPDTTGLVFPPWPPALQEAIEREEREQTPKLLIQESFVNATEGYRLGESGIYEPYTQDIGELYRAMVREHGRCTGRVYIDTKDGTKAIGWVFLKRKKYDDCNKTFLAETWVTLHEQIPEIHVTHHYLKLK